MQYVGGKQKSGGAQIAGVINTLVKRRKLRTVAEPFCGGLSITYRLKAPQVHASDGCEALITLYRRMQQGWRPPDLLTREEWERLRAANDPGNPMTAFAGFGCSRSGGWFSSFIEFNRRNYTDIPAALAARESLENKLARCKMVGFKAGDYRELVEVLAADLVYCDPPYKGTIPYKAIVEPFDSDASWAWARATSERRLVMVSERVAPEDFVPLLTFSLQNRLVTRAGGERRVEHAFVHESQLETWREAL